MPLLVTSRFPEYVAAVDAVGVLTRAAAVQLTDLTVDDLVGYLPRTTRKLKDASRPLATKSLLKDWVGGVGVGVSG